MNIIVNGEFVPAEQLLFGVGFIKTNADIHAQVTADLSDALDNELERAHQAACLMTANTLVAIAKIGVELIEAGELGAAAGAVAELSTSLYGLHDRHYVNWESCRDGNHPDLPVDLEARRASLPGRLASLSSEVEALKSTVEALPGSDTKANASALLKVIHEIIEGAKSSIEVVTGTATIVVTEERVAATIAQIENTLRNAGRDEDFIRFIIEEKIGSTLDEQIQSLTDIERRSLSLDEQGTKDGAAIAADAELTIGEDAVARLKALIQ